MELFLDIVRDGAATRVVVKPGADGTFGWVDALHHDWDGALRAFRYLAQKAAAGYAADDPKAIKVLESVARHIAALERVKADVVDRVVPLER